ncbi:acyl-CoA thioesterase YciA [Kytococcus aerolatus]|uniref:Acyl-CoA thioesterase YciA n=1 Tax=Kytococcus aerolatus TaxID=592308 RepID=A0A212T1P5_9MICO|nr:acyl-CoA thioesterase [Kytococcus aerolatus]SNC59751.1 acyl-CoA thioesterase YciA [Kytococcus aerolatus]
MSSNTLHAPAPADDPAEPATPPEHLEPTIRVTAMPGDANMYGDIFGGWLMAQMDLAASSVASRRARGRAVTVAVDSMSFHRPVVVGSELSVYAHLTGSRRTSMRVSVQAWARDRHAEDERLITRAEFTFVATDGDGRPRELPTEG